jgi:putative addiction module antidote
VWLSGLPRRFAPRNDDREFSSRDLSAPVLHVLNNGEILLYWMYNEVAAVGVAVMNDQTKIPDPRAHVIATVEIKKIGNSSGLIFPKEVMARLNLKVGDELYATLTPDGGIRLTPYDPDFEKAMEVARRGMKKYHNALAELAK